MSSDYDKYLDSNYPIDGDRIITERQYQREQAVGGLLMLVGVLIWVVNRILPLPRLVRLLVAIAGAGLIWYWVAYRFSPVDGPAPLISLIPAGIAALILYFALSLVLLLALSVSIYKTSGLAWAVFMFVAPLGIAVIVRRERAAGRGRISVLPLLGGIVLAVVGVVAVFIGAIALFEHQQRDSGSTTTADATVMDTTISVTYSSPSSRSMHGSSVATAPHNQ